MGKSRNTQNSKSADASHTLKSADSAQIPISDLDTLALNSCMIVFNTETRPRIDFRWIFPRDDVSSSGERGLEGLKTRGWQRRHRHQVD